MDDGTGTPMRPAAFAAAMAQPSGPVPPGSGALSLVGDATLTQSPTAGGICVFSGGTAANSLVDAFLAVAANVGQHAGAAPGRKGRKSEPCPLTYIIPISDNGGSSSELIRFFGGPSVGDIRSRLVRLIPTSDEEEDGQPGSGATNARAALRALFEHRLCASDPVQARAEWLDIVEARHLLWTFVPSPTRELIRAVLNTLNLEIVKRARPTSVFNFAAASVGNLFLTGARLFSGSFEAAIYLLSLLCGIPDHVAVLPAINSNFTHHISAGLADGTTIAGQVNISHPSAPTSLPDRGAVDAAGVIGTGAGAMRARAPTAVDFEDATLPGSLPALRQPAIAFSKDDEEDLPARIARVWYINPYGHEIRPLANPKALAALQQARAVVYSIGSLYTSILPSLVLRGVGAAIGDDEDGERPRQKVLILNSKLDRETGPQRDPMTAVDFVRAIAAACQQSRLDFGPVADTACRRYVTHLLYLDDASQHRNSPRVDEAALARLGIRCVAVPTQRKSTCHPRRDDSKAMDRYDETALTSALERILEEKSG